MSTKHTRTTRGRQKNTSSQASHVSTQNVDTVEPELDLADVWQQLEEKRAKWADPGASDSFHLQVRGGAWTAVNRHVAFDSLMAAAEKGLAAEWAKANHMGQVITFGFNLYTEEQA